MSPPVWWRSSPAPLALIATAVAIGILHRPRDNNHLLILASIRRPLTIVDGYHSHTSLNTLFHNYEYHFHADQAGQDVPGPDMLAEVVRELRRRYSPGQQITEQTWLSRLAYRPAVEPGHADIGGASRAQCRPECLGHADRLNLQATDQPRRSPAA